MKRILSFFNKKKFKHGGMAIILTAVFIAAVILINVIAGLVLDRFDTSLDFSANRMFSIEQDTIDFLAEITDNVTITVMSRENDFVGLGSFYNQTNEILKRFDGISNNIEIRYMDLMANPDFVANYEGLRTDSIIIESEKTGRYRILNSQDYLNITYYDTRTGAQISEQEYHMLVSMGAAGMAEADVSAAAESVLLSAILSVTNVSPVYVGFVTGYGESRNQQIEHLLELNAYTTQIVDIVTREIDPDLDFLIIYAPTADYSDESLSKLNAWLDNDGQFGRSLLYVSHHNAETPNIDDFLAEWGIEIERAYVIQTDAQFIAPMAELRMMVQHYNPRAFSEGLNPAFRIFGGEMRHIELIFEAWTNIETTPILATHDGAVLVPFDSIDPETGVPDFDLASAERGVYNIGVMSSKIRFDDAEGNFEPITSNVIAFGGWSVFAREFMTMQNANNADYFINMMNDLSGNETVITLMPKSFSVTTFDISQEQSRTIGLIFAIALPVVIIITGVVIWIKRIRS